MLKSSANTRNRKRILSATRRAWRRFVRRNLIDDAPADLDEVEAIIDKLPRTPTDRFLTLLVFLLSIAVWLPIFALFVASSR
ncbi:hypothetical protein [Prosthecodimorpha hirschii]|uniref:hypothetical protein n=1 Tax=Prosthecodimorpha hirschii TaxID=665126 RepID=UPI00112D2F72|nr:hypothetical protein [Prosthecomicrobium hirschii]